MLLLHSQARNRLVETWSRRQEIQKVETSPEVNHGMCSRREKCDKRHLTDRKTMSKCVHSLLIVYGKTEVEEVVSSLTITLWLSLDLSCDCPNLLRSPSAMIPAQVLTDTACFCYVLATFSENGAHLHSCNSCKLPTSDSGGGAHQELSIQHEERDIQKPPWPMAYLAGSQH